MKYTNLFLCTIVFCGSCTAQSVKLNIPDKVTVQPTSSYRQVPGTHIFLTPPKNYNLVEQLLRFQKDEKTYIQAVELPAPFNKKQVLQSIADKKKTGQLTSEYYMKEYMQGDCEAILVYGADTKPGMEQIVLIFGYRNTKISAMVAAEIPAKNTIARDEVVKALLTSYIDTTIEIDPTKLANYSIDISNTPFKYAGNSSQMYFYNLSGSISDATESEFGTQFTIGTFPPLSESECKKFIESMIQGQQGNNIQIKEIKQKETTLNGNYAYETEYTGTYKNKTVSALMIITRNENAAVLFAGNCFEKHTETMKELKKIAATLRPK